MTSTEPLNTLRFRGLALCEGIKINVTKEGDEEQFFLAIWNQKERECFKKIDYGEDWPEERRRWRKFTFEIKA